MNRLVERFFNYIKINTQSNENVEESPSTIGQLNLANYLREELINLGLTDVSLDTNGYIMATLPSNTDKDVPTVGFVSHMDTSPEMSGENINPKITKEYNGKDIILNKDKNIVLFVNQFPEIKNYKGQDIITTDGTTLLGADDKAGIAEIITAIEFLKRNSSIIHGDVKICFTPDEEIGRGVDDFNIEKFGADFAYTIDGGEIGELEYENFNAASSIVKVKGLSVHPGTAKDKMINSIEIAMEFASLLPKKEKPEYTENYEGFFHLYQFDGGIEDTILKYIIRDHNKEKFKEKKEMMKSLGEKINLKYNQKLIEIEIEDQYYNMKEKIEEVFEIIEIAKESYEEAGIIPNIKPIRGGTDGARLSFIGLPCPNIFTGGHNFHGKFEYIPIQSMEKSVDVIINLVKKVYEKKEMLNKQ